MDPSSRFATGDDAHAVLGLYREAVGEQAALRPMWPLADGLAEPADVAVSDILGDPGSRLAVGEIDGVVVGFAWGVQVSRSCPRPVGRRCVSCGWCTPPPRPGEWGLGTACSPS